MKTLLIITALLSSSLFAKDKVIALCDGAENAGIRLLEINKSTFKLIPEEGAYHFGSQFIESVLNETLNLDFKNSTYLSMKLGVEGSRDIELYFLKDEENKNMKINIFTNSITDRKLSDSMNCDLLTDRQ